MKRIKFKKPINGFGNALKLIPESYKVNGNEFEMTDMNETYRIKWDNGKARIIDANDSKIVSEDFKAIKKLMTYKSSDYISTDVKVSANESFSKMLSECKATKLKEDNEKALDTKLSLEDENALKALVKSKGETIKDSDIHTFAEKRGLDVPTIEAFIYKIAAKSLK
jgi:hypothetical protein